MYCDATAVLKIGSVYQHCKIHYPPVFAEVFKYTDVERQQCITLSDSDDDGYFVV